MNLPLQLVPEEGDGHVRVFGHLPPFATLIVGVKDEAAAHDLLEQDRADARPTVWCGRGHDHGGGFVDLRFEGLIEPLIHHFERIVGQFFSAQAARGILAADIL